MKVKVTLEYESKRHFYETEENPKPTNEQVEEMVLKELDSRLLDEIEYDIKFVEIEY